MVHVIRFLVIAALFLSVPAGAADLNLYLARHGQTETNKEHLVIGQMLHPGAVLTESGKEHARTLTALLKDKGIKKIYVSSLARSQQTAEPIAKELDLTPVVRSQLNEMNLGTLEGKLVYGNDFQIALRQMYADPNYHPGGGESLADLELRVSQFIHELNRSDQPETILVIAHLGSIQALLTLYLKLSPAEGAVIRPRNDDVYRLKVQKGAVKKVALSQARAPFQSVVVADLLRGGPPAAEAKPIPQPAAADAKREASEAKPK